MIVQAYKRNNKKALGLWHSCQRSSHPSELNYSQMVQQS